MQQQECVFLYKGAKLHYSCTGKGNTVLLAFHGYGQTHLHYRHIAWQLSDRYTIYAFDLFFHGKSIWHLKDHPLSKEFLAEMMTMFLETHQISKFSLIGFSMGSKIALSILESFPQRVSELILIAPDSIKTSFWYSLATYPDWTKKHFRKVAISPTYFLNLSSVLRKLRLVDKGIVRFAQNQMNTRQKRLRVYYSWMVFRKLKFDMRHIADLINTYRIPITMFLGSYDRIVTKKNMQVLLTKLHSHQLIVLQTGHNQLLEEVAQYYARETTPVQTDK